MKCELVAIEEYLTKNVTGEPYLIIKIDDIAEEDGEYYLSHRIDDNTTTTYHRQGNSLIAVI